MSHPDETVATIGRSGLIRDAVVGLLLAVAGGASLFYLVGEYRAAAPWREAKAVEYAREREAREKAEAAGKAGEAPEASPPPVQGPVEWVTAPQWPPLTTEVLPEGVEQVSVRFDCRLDAEGVLSECKGVDTPAGAGMAERLLPALTSARMKPMQRNGRPVRSTVSFSVHFSTGDATAAAPPPPVAAPPAPGG